MESLEGVPFSGLEHVAVVDLLIEGFVEVAVVVVGEGHSYRHIICSRAKLGGEIGIVAQAHRILLSGHDDFLLTRHVGEFIAYAVHVGV